MSKHLSAVLLSLTALTLGACDPEDSGDSGAVLDGTEVRVTGEPDPRARFVLGDLSFEDADGDGDWAPGEAGIVRLSFTETSGEDYMAYPGVRLSADQAGVVEAGEYWWYGIFGGGTYDVGFTVVAPEDAASGDVVAFSAEVSSLSCEDGSWGEDACPDPNPLDFEINVW